MKTRYALLLSLLLPLLGACSKDPEPPAQAAPAADAASTPAPPATTAPPATAPATSDPATPEATAAPNTNPVVPPEGPAPIEGTDYVTIEGGQPFEPAEGTIEVVEFFNYICPACNAFDPMLQTWKARQPADVRLVYVPASFRPDFAAYARAYYAAEALGLVQKTHQAAYAAVHDSQTLPGEGQPVDEDRIAAFYAGYGTTAGEFLSTMKSFAVNGKLNKANNFAVRSQIGGTPSLVVNGKYLVKGRSWEDMLRITDHLIARERAAPSGSAS